jgi:hypothetical protein
MILKHMAFKVFLSYSTDPEEQAVVWRLQTLAAAHGIQVYVPYRPEPTTTRPTAKFQLSKEVRSAINKADCVMAVITSRVLPMVQEELCYALGKCKLVIPIVRAGVPNCSSLGMIPRVFLYSPACNAGKVESQIIEFLKEETLSKQNQQAIAALAGVALGMLLLCDLAQRKRPPLPNRRARDRGGRRSLP